MNRHRFNLLWLLLLPLLAAGCAQEPAVEPAAIMKRDLNAGNAAEIVRETKAAIYLRELPDPVISVQDESGRMWMVVSGGLENVGVGSYVLLEGGGKGVRPEAIAQYTWSLETPAGSASQLDDPSSRTPIFIPDTSGLYRVGLTIANQAGVEAKPASLTIHAGTWVGNGSIAGGSDDPHQCIECHPEKVKTWSGTRHAISLQRAMDGQASPFYFEHCIQCHTVGKDPLADNNGFDDVARELGWSYPEELKPGNYDDLVANYPRLANLGNTQCELCHGPGSDHEEQDPYIAVSLRPEVCIQCHDFLQQDQYAQWSVSSHSDTQLPNLFPDGIDEKLCSTCHTTRGFIAAADGAEIVPGGDEYLSCQACHDPHAAPGDNVYQIRYFGSIRLPDGTNVMNAGSSALCIHCHNVGETPDWVEHDYDPLQVPPPQASAAEMLAGTGGYTYGQELDNSPHANTTRWSGGCVSCHMISSAAGNSGDFLSSSMNEPVGEHTFRVRYDNGTPDDPGDDVENLQACDGCHGQVPRLNGPAAADYDGDGKTENVQDEVQGLLDLVRQELLAAGVPWTDTAPYWGQTPDRALRIGIYNWSVVNNDGSRGVHNTARSVELLQLTYRELAGQDVPGAVLRAGNSPSSTLQERFHGEKSLFQKIKELF